MPWGEFEGDVNSSDIPQYLVKSYIPGDNNTAERMNIARVISSCPKKVQDAITAGTQIVVGKYSASGYDYINDVLHIAKGAFPEEIAHEIGHLIDNKLISKRDRDVLLKKLFQTANPRMCLMNLFMII